MERPTSSRRNSITSFSSATSIASSVISTTPRDLSTDSMYDLQQKFQRKSRSKTKIQQPMVIRSNSYSSHQSHQNRYSQHQVPHRSQHQRYRSFQQPQPQPPLLQQQQQNGSFYFPNGEIFTPRQTPKTRNRPSKVHHNQYQPPPQQQQQQQQLQVPVQQQRRYPVLQTPSMPNVVVSNQNGVPPRRNPGLMRNSISFQNPMISQRQQDEQHLQPGIEFLHENKRPSSVSSLGSSPNKLQQVSSTSSSTISLNQLHSSSSSTPSNIDDTPASSISYDEKLTSLTSEISNVEKVIQEKDIVEEVESKESIIREEEEEEEQEQEQQEEQQDEEEKEEKEEKEEQSTTPIIELPVKSMEKSKSNPIVEKPLTIIPVVPRHISNSTLPSPIEKKSFIGKVFKRLFGSNKKSKIDKTSKNRTLLSRRAVETKGLSKEIDEIKLDEILPNIDVTDTDFRIDFDEELKDTESLLSFTKNDENDINISNKKPDTNIAKKRTENDDGDDDDDDDDDGIKNYMDFADDENFLLKLIEVGETTFPDLDKPDLGTTRRKSLKMQKNLSRNSTISSQNSNTSMKTFKTSSSYLEELDRMISNFENSNSHDDRIENLQIIRNNTLKLPHKLLKSFKSSLKTNTSIKTSKSHVVFANTIYINDTHSSSEYDRFNIDLKRHYQMLSSNPQLVKEIRFELNAFKELMEIHELSRQNTHLFGC